MALDACVTEKTPRGVEKEEALEHIDKKQLTHIDTDKKIGLLLPCCLNAYIVYKTWPYYKLTLNQP